MTTDQPTNVYQAIAAVTAGLPAIGKDGKAAASQGGYAYRGIEQITRAAQSLFGKHGLVCVPEVEDIEIRDIIVAGKPWTDTQLRVRYHLFGPDGSTVQAVTVGIGRDNSDKGANKAMSQAFKYLLLQVFCISDAKDDTDGSTHEADGPSAERPAPADRPMTDAEFDKFVTACETAGIDALDLLETVRPGKSDMPQLSERPAMLAEYTRRKTAGTTQAPAPEDDDVPPPVDPEPENASETGNEPGVEEVLLASKAQVRKIQTMFGKLGVKDRDEKLRMVSDTLGIEKPASTNVLTGDEAHILIEALETREKEGTQ